MNARLKTWGGAITGMAKTATATLALVLIASCSDPHDWGAIQVVHALQSPFATAEALGSDGKTLRTVSFACAPGQSCQLMLPKDLLAQTTALRFRDSLGRLVGAYSNANLANVGYTVKADAGMMGVELFNRLVAQGSYTPNTLVYLADAHIYRETPAGPRPSLFEDLQAHYQRALNDATYNEQKYVVDVLKAIADSTGAQASSANNPGISAQVAPPRVRTLATSGASSSVTPACSAGFSALNAVAGLGSLAAYTANPVLGMAISSVSGLIGGMCSQFTLVGALTQVLQSLDQIQTSLNALDTKLNGLGIRLNEIAAQAAFSSFLNSYTNYKTDLSSVKSHVNAYKSLLRPTASGYTLPTYADLGSYIKALPGGLNADTWANNLALQQLLGGWSDAVDKYNNLVDISRATSMSSSLQSLCMRERDINGDIIVRRTQCNLMNLQVMAQSTAVLTELGIVITDTLTAIDAEFAAAAASNDQAKLRWLSANILNKKYPGQSWPDTRKQVLNDMLTNLNLVAGQMQAAMIAPTTGLPDTLQANMVLAGCDKSVGGQAVAAIEAWVINEASPAGAAQPSPYITTQCKGRYEELVYSRFHYGTDVGTANTVLNMLGVLINPTTAASEITVYATPAIFATLQFSTGPRPCMDDYASRCDWWMAVPGDANHKTVNGLQQVRSHTGKATSSSQRVPVQDDFLYNPPTINDRLVHPVTTVLGRTNGYSGTPIQYLWSSIYRSDPRGSASVIQQGYLSYTWINDVNAWSQKPDRLYTRTVVMRVGQRHTQIDSSWPFDPRYSTDFFAHCATADCTLTDQLSGTNIYGSITITSGPKIRWGAFAGETGLWHMFINDKAPDGRAYVAN